MLTARDAAPCFSYNRLAATHFIAVKHSAGRFPTGAEVPLYCTQIPAWSCWIGLDCVVCSVNKVIFDELCLCVRARHVTVLKLWKRPMLAGCGDSRGNWRKGFMSSGAGMTGGLLRKAGTGPGRFTLPVVETQTGK